LDGRVKPGHDEENQRTREVFVLAEEFGAA
jgi:hypothetical protein